MKSGIARSRKSSAARQPQRSVIIVFSSEGALKLDRLPRKHKERVVVLDRIAGLFEPGRRYSEQEVNGMIAPVTSDCVTVRRSLIDFGFLDRADGGGEYWRR